MKHSRTIDNESLQVLVKRLIDDLRDRGYSENTLRNYYNRLRPIQCFMEDNEQKSYTPDIGSKYLTHYLSINTPGIVLQREIEATISRLNDQYSNRDYVPQHSTVPTIEILPGFMSSYIAYSAACRQNGNKPSTIKRKQRAIKLFLSRCALSNTSEPFALTPAMVLNACLCANNKDDWADVRAFLSFIAVNGFSQSDLSTFTPHYVREKKIPTAYRKEEIWAVENIVDRSTEVGKRDYAMILLASRLGIRAGDIVRMTYESLNFSNDTISFNQQKTGIPICLPMIPAVKEALLDYIKNVTINPDVAIFENSRAPHHAIFSTAFSRRIGIHFHRAGIDVSNKKHGPHSLRSSLASAMVNSDVPYDAVRKILGHVSPNVISRYAKVDIEKLRRCAIEVPDSLGGLMAFLNGGSKHAKV